MSSPLDPARYQTPTAFLAALEVRLREASGEDHRRWNLMRTQFAISRLLVRLQSVQPGEWVVKGGTSMLARLEGRCRLSRDLDVMYRELARDGEESIRRAADRDEGDWLSFRVVDSQPLRQDDIHGLRFRLGAWVGRKELVRFGVDVVHEAYLAGQLELREPYTPVAVAGRERVVIPVYPVEDHIADKVSAMGKIRHHGDQVVASTRYRDLADLALLAASVPAAAAPLAAALDAPARRWARDAFGETGLRPPGAEWPTRYADTVRAEPYVVDRWPTAEAALAAAKPLVDPVLTGTARGTWDPVAGRWRS